MNSHHFFLNLKARTIKSNVPSFVLSIDVLQSSTNVIHGQKRAKTAPKNDWNMPGCINNGELSENIRLELFTVEEYQKLDRQSQSLYSLQ